MKREWKKPIISVVVRGSSEENVLWTCKKVTGAESDTGPSSGNCGYNWEANAYCNENFPS
jgi:hypothetical protein